MRERGPLVGLDRYFRREDTLLATALNKISPHCGQDYIDSSRKRVAELAITIPPAILALPVIVALAAAAKIEDGGSFFYVDQRLGRDQRPFPVIKIRSMRKGSDNAMVNLLNAERFSAGGDPRNTRVGRFMRRHELEELPELFQVIRGYLSLVGIRAAPQYVFDYLEKIRARTFDRWKEAYFSGRPGLVSLNASMNPNHKDNRRRYHYDVFYAKRASLGLDLYILYRAARKVLGGFFPKKRASINSG